MAKEIAISVDGVKKDFVLPHESQGSIKTGIVNVFKKKKRGYEVQHALKDISFEVEKGDFFGIVGRNGSGKSTLLKIISKIYKPTAGSVTTNGRIVPFIELGVGFNPELTGRENVFLNGALLGFSRKEVTDMYDDIVEFAELERFMDQKLKNYSSGMQVRLAFSIAIRADADVLILDEVLAVGDEAFQKKCNDYFAEIKKDKNKTVVLVTHDMESVRRYCNKAVLIKDGLVAIEGTPDKVADEYSLQNMQVISNIAVSSDDAYITAQTTSSKQLKNDERFELEIKYRNKNKVPVFLKIAIQYRDTTIMVTNSQVVHGKDFTTDDTELHTVKYTLPLETFNSGEFNAVVLLVDEATGVNLASYGYGKELFFKVSNPMTGSLVGGAISNVGFLES